MSDLQLEQARTRVRALRWFYVHVAVYLVVMVGITLINVVLSRGYWWVVWPMTGWAIVVAGHAVWAYYGRSVLDDEWEERKTRELAGRRRQET